MCDIVKRWTIKGRKHDSVEGRKKRESRNRKKVRTGREMKIENINHIGKKHQIACKQNIVAGEMDTSCGRDD
jgi:ribosomal protein S8E